MRRKTTHRPDAEFAAHLPARGQSDRESITGMSAPVGLAAGGKKLSEAVALEGGFLGTGGVASHLKLRVPHTPAKGNPMNDHDLLQIQAQLSAQRFLLEIMYSNAFSSDSSGFKTLMNELQRLTRDAPVTSEPISTEEQKEYLTEWQACTATHLQRFETSVVARIASGRKI